jgi:hypothetical protein
VSLNAPAHFFSNSAKVGCFFGADFITLLLGTTITLTEILESEEYSLGTGITPLSTIELNAIVRITSKIIIFVCKVSQNFTIPQIFLQKLSKYPFFVQICPREHFYTRENRAKSASLQKKKHPSYLRVFVLNPLTTRN